MPDILTPEMIKALIDAGEMSLADVQLLSTEEKKVALPLILNHPYGEMEGEMGKAMTPGFGKINLGKAPSSPPAGPPRGSNFERHGNVTRPGPDALKGGGGPSRPSGKVDNPLDRSETLKGPSGNPSNYRTAPRKGEAGRSGSGDEVDSRISGLPPKDRRSPDRPADVAGMSDVRDDQYRKLLSQFGGKPGTRTSPTHRFDEADKKAAMFGGLNPAQTGYRRPQDRRPLSKKEIEQMIQNMLRIAEEFGR